MTTFVSHYEFANWLGVNKWKYFGFDDPIGINKVKCPCLQEYPHSNKIISRQEIKGLLEFAERTFVDLAKFYPGKYQIYGEQKAYKNFIEPEYNKNSELGISKLDYVGEFNLTKVDNLSNLLDTFYFKFAVYEENFNINKVRVYLPDCSPLDFNDREDQIRPLNIVHKNNEVYITGEPVLFKKKELYDQESCIQHSVDSYVDTVLVYIEYIDYNQKGFLNGQESITTHKKVYGSNMSYFEITNNCVKAPNYLTYNYTTGDDFLNGQYLNKKYTETISKLALALSPTVKSFCNCDGCPEGKINYYRKVPTAVVGANDPQSSGQDFDYQVLITKEEIKNTFGYYPGLGFNQAVQEIKQFRFKTVEGATLYGTRRI